MKHYRLNPDTGELRLATWAEVFLDAWARFERDGEERAEARAVLEADDNLDCVTIPLERSDDALPPH